MNKDKWGIYHGWEDLIFWNLKNILTLQKNWNVWIWTSTPQANLTIQNETDGSDTITQLRSSDSGFGTNQELRVDFQQTLTTTARQSMAYFGPDWWFNFYWYVSWLNATPILTMRGNSKVWIWTTNPWTKLDIKSTRTSGNNENLITLSDPVTWLQTPGFGTRILWSSNAGNALSAIGFEAGTTWTNNDTQLSFYTQSSAGGLAQRMVVNQVGNIWIWVSNPWSKLEVKWDIKIKWVSGWWWTPIDLWLNINWGNGWATSLVLCSMNHGAWDNTISAIYMIRSGYDWNNYWRYYLWWSSDYVTFTIDWSWNLFYTWPAWNNQCSVFKSSR
ncbi:MAG: hypothetical protein ACD_3C00020G0001 [uncultured bacterium (gcode 4)]|uniref:Uncharacterized protein n=1 Tax=uncultured bacterium (gcode 4) TaxID=1234023 RepID=K2GER5_9BACT|nr:MAG: hypothetical protein ACD_3C00020G0001 [uncultured bacterium (gcode 4)]